jgi:HK97 family phage major capsid protein
MGMKSLDLIKQEKAAIMQKLNQAMKDNDEEAFAQAFTEFTNNIQEAVMMEARGLIQAADSTVLAGRGARALTSEENKYYEAVIEAMKSTNPKQALTAVTVVFPKTVIDAVFEDLVNEHPLLDEIDFVNTSGLIEYLINTGSAPLATWKALTATIADELTRGFEKIDLAHKKLSAFIPVAKAMLDLGPAWLDRFTRAILGEALANGLEAGIIDGDGLLEPVGMNKNLSAAVDPSTGYAKKTKIPVADFGADNYGGLISQLTVGPNGVIRTIKEVILIVNPVDYLTKVMPATSQLINGVWVRDIFPFPTKVIQSTEVTVGSAIMGIGKKYFMGIGTAKGGKIEYSDEYHFLEDERVYLIKLYGTGRPVDNKAFLYLDISALKPYYPVVRTTNYVDTGLKSIVVEGGTLSPVFDDGVTLYTTSVAAAKSDFTAVANDANATIAVTLNGASATNGGEQTWVEGQNTVVVTVTNAGNVKTYVVLVTYTVA